MIIHSAFNEYLLSTYSVCARHLFHVLEIQPFQSPCLEDLKQMHIINQKKRKMALDMQSVKENSGVLQVESFGTHTLRCLAPQNVLESPLRK